ncbi:formate/nitrite transporter family protein [Limnohabitans sp. Rim8]|uniref:formate/nitrite transporter family protein n=1 Tax=Limnohabitans sp. Rim8 TaxID=1100718 RepID=UPI00260D1955|nr:formate/nitrite transporter family protein [Limnohabitans sp. Rim8]
MSDLDGSDAYSPVEIARRVEAVGEAKARMAALPLALLGVLAGAFIGLGAMLFVLVKSDPTLGFAVSALLGGLVFSLGLFMVVVAGAELFTGNNLIAMAWADGRVSTAQLLRNWVIVCLANFVGAAGLALLVWASGHASLNGGAIGQKVLQIALAKQELPFFTALLRGVLCNVLVCMAVWMAMGGRSLVDKAVAVVFPVMAFVAAGFEHSIANMYLMPLAMLLQHGGLTGGAPVTWGGMLGNLMPVILGNVLGGAVLVAGVYHVIYKRHRCLSAPAR